jgi:hypothetical protein
MKASGLRRGRAVFLLLGAGLLALSGSSPAPDQEAAEIAPQKSSFVVLPIIYHTPETGWGGGFGGENIMRGYYSGRFRDKILASFQAEYRFPVWWKLGLAAFLGAGDVSDMLGHLKLAPFKLSAGWGIRFKASSQEGATIRLDFGYGKNCSGMYFTAKEAF